MGLPRASRSGCLRLGLRCIQPTSIPLGVPHLLTEEDNYRGYVVPGGTTILANAWYAYHTPPRQEPERFNFGVPGR